MGINMEDKLLEKLEWLKSKQGQKVSNFGMVGMGYVVEYHNLALELIKLQDQRIENLLKAVEFYASKDSWRDLIAEEGGPSCLILEGVCDCIIAEDLSFNEEFGGEKARQALARDKDLTKEK
jgi:hypothetical protein